MIAILKYFNGWFAYIPPKEDLFSKEEKSEAYIKRHLLPIYKFDTIIEKLREDDKIVGEIFTSENNSYFKLEHVSYKEEIKNENKEYKACTLCEYFLQKYNKIALSKEQYMYLYNVAISENSISSKLSNGFCINYTYVIYGKLTKDKKHICRPQLKRKFNKNKK